MQTHDSTFMSCGQVNYLFGRLWNTWFQISADSDTYRRYRIGFWGTKYDISGIISVKTGTNIADSAEIANIDNQYWYYKLLADTDTKIEILNHVEIACKKRSLEILWFWHVCSLVLRTKLQNRINARGSPLRPIVRNYLLDWDTT